MLTPQHDMGHAGTPKSARRGAAAPLCTVVAMGQGEAEDRGLSLLIPQSPDSCLAVPWQRLKFRACSASIIYTNHPAGRPRAAVPPRSQPRARTSPAARGAGEICTPLVMNAKLSQ